MKSVYRFICVCYSLSILPLIGFSQVQNFEYVAYFSSTSIQNYAENFPNVDLRTGRTFSKPFIIDNPRQNFNQVLPANYSVIHRVKVIFSVPPTVLHTNYRVIIHWVAPIITNNSWSTIHYKIYSSSDPNRYRIPWYDLGAGNKIEPVRFSLEDLQNGNIYIDLRIDKEARGFIRGADYNIGGRMEISFGN